VTPDEALTRQLALYRQTTGEQRLKIALDLHKFAERCMFDRRLPMMLFGTPARIATAEDVLLHKLHWNSISCFLDGKDASGVQQLPLRGSVKERVSPGVVTVALPRRISGHRPGIRGLSATAC
jgi:hypothetical protein